MSLPLRLLTAGLAVGLVSCSDSFISSPAPSTNPESTSLVVQAVSCLAHVKTGTVQCSNLTADSPGLVKGSLRPNIIIGEQGVYVRLTSSNVSYNTSSQEFSFDVTVQNLIEQSFGTQDGTTPDPNGVRVFFSQTPVANTLLDNDGPSTISIANADGVDVFTATNQPYFQYTGGALGADEILSTNEVSTSKTWILSINPNVETFSFLLYVSTSVAHANGYVDLTGTDYILANESASFTATSRSAAGTLSTTDTVKFSSLDTTVAVIDSLTGEVTAKAPGTTTISASARNGIRTASKTLSVCPNLAVGQTYVTSGLGASLLCLSGGSSGSAEYVAVPVNQSPTSSISLSFTTNGSVAVTGPPSPNVVLGRGEFSASPLGLMAGAETKDIFANESKINAMANRGLPSISKGARINSSYPTARFNVAGNKQPSVRRTITTGVPTVGSDMNLNVALGCSGTPDMRVGRVIAISDRAIIVADTHNPVGGFTTQEYESIATEFDTISYAITKSNFGEPTDLDNNGRVVLFFTRALNELSPPASSAITHGYFAKRDVFSSDPVSGCSRSNEGEIIYLMVPDPTGVVNSNVRTVSSVLGNVQRVLPHTLQHLVNAFRRVYITGASDFEAEWLDEGLSSIATELAFYHMSLGLIPNSNINLSNLTNGPFASRRVAAFNSYANILFGQLRSGLQRPDTTGAFRSPGDESSIRPATRGFTWGFLRYASERANLGDSTFWWSLVNSSNSGMTNLQNAIGGDSVSNWYRDFVVSLYSDDAVSGISSVYQYASWNFRSVYDGLGGYPLGTRPLINQVPLTLSLTSYGSIYARFGVAANGFASFSISAQGNPVPSTVDLTIMRTK